MEFEERTKKVNQLRMLARGYKALYKDKARAYAAAAEATLNPADLNNCSVCFRGEQPWRWTGEK